MAKINSAVPKMTATQLAEMKREQAANGALGKKRKAYYIPVSERLAERKKGTAGKKVEKQIRLATVATKILPKPKEQKEIASVSGSEATECSVCGKPLSRHSSVENGMGEVCASKIKMLPAGTTLEDHYAKIMVDDIPEGYIKLKDAIAKLNEKGVSTYRIIQAIGGERMILKPLNSHFKVVMVNHVRYINNEAIRNWRELEKV